uniref:Uncharacterized protein n=1 Tax=Octopus bimaculoides TaxID=37653 RepID=A0A0L8FU83_OCTBM
MNRAQVQKGQRRLTKKFRCPNCRYATGITALNLLYSLPSELIYVIRCIYIHIYT